MSWERVSHLHDLMHSGNSAFRENRLDQVSFSTLRVSCFRRGRCGACRSTYVFIQDRGGVTSLKSISCCVKSDRWLLGLCRYGLFDFKHLFWLVVFVSMFCQLLLRCVFTNSLNLEEVKSLLILFSWKNTAVKHIWTLWLAISILVVYIDYIHGLICANQY